MYTNYKISVKQNGDFQRIKCSQDLIGHIYVYSFSIRDEETKNHLDGLSGIYILQGVSEDTEGTITYIGQTTNIKKRLQDHSNKKAWVDQVYFCTIGQDPKHNSFGKINAYLHCIETEFIERATKQGIKLDNSQMPSKASSSYESSYINEVKSFVDESIKILRIMNINIFSKASLNRVETEFESHKYNNAKGYLDQGKFIVMKGSKCEKNLEEFENSIKDPKTIKRLKPILEELYNKGIINEHKEFTEDYTFNSPSQAACIIAGGSVNGKDKWNL
ncbi:MAG: DUF4357 domain-containing protein [Alistipes sp.]|nr:DUF4357 domain-containing protein [Alistipes sp.]